MTWRRQNARNACENATRGGKNPSRRFPNARFPIRVELLPACSSERGEKQTASRDCEDGPKEWKQNFLYHIARRRAKAAFAALDLPYTGVLSQNIGIPISWSWERKENVIIIAFRYATHHYMYHRIPSYHLFISFVVSSMAWHGWSRIFIISVSSSERQVASERGPVGDQMGWKGGRWVVC